MSSDSDAMGNQRRSSRASTAARLGIAACAPWRVVASAPAVQANESALAAGINHSQLIPDLRMHIII
jgi:hypothetical protein